MIPDDINNQSSVTADLTNDLQPLGGSHNYQHKQIIDDDGSEDVGGHMQGLDTDDNALDTLKEVGADVDSGEENQQPLNIGAQVQKAEKERAEGEY